MDLNQTVQGAKNDLDNLKKDPKSFWKVNWLIPVAAAIALWISQSFLVQNQKNPWLWVIIVALTALGVWTAYASSQKNPNPLKLGAGYFLIPVASVIAILVMPEVFGWIIGILFLWAGIAALAKYKPWENWTKKEQ